MNPFDAIGTARVSQAIADRICRVSIPTSTRRASARSFAGEARADGPEVEIAVAVTRGTRTHAAIRTGSSVRGAIDMVRLARGLTQLREQEPLAATPAGCARSQRCPGGSGSTRTRTARPRR